MFSRVHALGVDAMNRQHELHIKKLSADNLLPIIRQSEFADLADSIEQCNITGEDLLVLKEYDFLLKSGSNVNGRLVARLLDSVQNRPQELFPLKPTLKPKPSFAGGGKASLSRTQSVRLVTGELAGKFSSRQTSVQLDERTSKGTDGSLEIVYGPSVDDKAAEATVEQRSGAKVKPPAILPKPAKLDQCDQPNLEGDVRADSIQLNTERHLQPVLNDAVPPNAAGDGSELFPAHHHVQQGETGSVLKPNDLHSSQPPANAALEGVGTSNATDQENRLDLDDVMNQFNDVLKLINFSQTAEPIPVSAATSTEEKKATPSNPDQILKKTKINDISDAKYLDEAQPRMIDHTYGTLSSAMSAAPSVVDVVKENTFYRDCDQATCRNMLANKPAGAFLIRSSANHVCVLVVRSRDRVKSIPMQYDVDERKFYLAAARGQVNRVRFSTLDDLVAYYRANEIDDDLLLKPQYNILASLGVNSDASPTRIRCREMATDAPVTLGEQKCDEYEQAPVLRENNAASREYSQLPPVSSLRAAAALDGDRYDSDLYLAPVKRKEAGLSLVTKHEAFRHVDRAGAKDLLRGTKRGTYLLRRSGEQQFLAVLVINGRLKMQNVPIWYNKSSGQFYLDTSACLEKQTFGSIDMLLKYYCVNAINGDKLAVDNRSHLPICGAQEQKTS